MDSKNRQLRLKDGRHLGYAEQGDPQGTPVLLFHGLPGSRLFRHPDDAVARELGARVISVDRPGYGLSDFKLGRKPLDWPSDVTELADGLGLERFAICGVSAGGAYAAACAAKLAHRVTRLGLVSSVAPFNAPDAVAGMDEERKRLIGLVQWVPWPVLQAYLSRGVRSMRRDEQTYFQRVLAGFPECDRQVVSADPAITDVVRADWLQAFRHGARAYAADIALTLRPWGFALSEVQAPTWVWHGDADTMVPPSMAQHLARALPHAHVTWFKGEGHTLVFTHWREIIHTLA